MAILLPNGKQAFTTALGLPLVGGKLYTYAAGTVTPKTTWQDANQIAANTNPVILNARGEASVFFDGAYKVELRDALDNVIWTVDNLVAAAVDPNLRANLAASTGAALVGYKRTGAVLATARTLAQRLDDLSVSAKEFGAKGDGLTDDLVAITNAMAFVAANGGGEVYLPAGDYRTTGPIAVPLLVALRGPANPFPQAAYNPSYTNSGAVIFKDHAGHAITKIGIAANGIYQQAAGLYNIGVRSNYVTYPTGDGIRVDYVGNMEIIGCAVYSVGGSAFTIGATATDVTGNIYLEALYANNPSTGSAFSIRARWVNGIMLYSDGGQCGIDAYNCTDCAFLNCHHEGVQIAGIRLGGSTVNNLFDHHWVLCNYPGSTAKGVQFFFSSPGSSLNVFRNCRILGNDSVGSVGVTVDTWAYSTSIEGCYFDGFKIGVSTISRFTRIVNGSQFYTIELPISISGDDSEIKDIVTDTTSGAWSIDHVIGSNGQWLNNNLDKPIKASHTGNPGYFDLNRVSGNKGYRTHARKTSGSVASGFTLAHGLAGAPLQFFATSVAPFALPADFKLTADATNWSATWTGGNIQVCLDASLYCEFPQ